MLPKVACARSETAVRVKPSANAVTVRRVMEIPPLDSAQIVSNPPVPVFRPGADLPLRQGRLDTRVRCEYARLTTFARRVESMQTLPFRGAGLLRGFLVLLVT